VNRATGAALDDREQRYAFLAAGLGAAVSVALWAPSFDERAGVALAAIGVMMSALLALAARRRSRLFTGGAAALLSFGPWGFVWLVGLPFLVLAAWLVLRAPRPEPRPRPERVPRRSRRQRADDDVDEDGEGLAVPAASRAPAGPPRASKRYTPPGSGRGKR
jgi:hypothetical protein